MSEPTTKKTPLDNVNESSRAATARVNVALPGVVVSYDSSTQRAVVHIVPCFRRKDPAQGGAIICYQPPDIPGVPVAFPGTDGFSFTWPITPGATGLIVFCDRSMDEWLQEGGINSEPQDIRRHDLTDAVFIPGMRSFANPVAADGVHGSAMVIKGDKIRLGSANADDPIALESLVDDELQDLKDMFDNWLPVAGDGGAALKLLWTTLTLTWPALTGASKVSAE